MTTHILNYGGGTQTAAMVRLVQLGILPRPDYVIAADTGREMPTTWQYADRHSRPALATISMELHIAGHELATVDLYAHNGDLLIPAFTQTGKLPKFCSQEWKTRVVERYARRVLGVDGPIIHWIGYSYDEIGRWKKAARQTTIAGQPTIGHADGSRIYPLVGLLLSKADCVRVIQEAGWPLPHKSRCYMCPFQHAAEWREVRALPEIWAEAVRLDNEIREEDISNGGKGVFVHRSRRPLSEAPIDGDEQEQADQCGLGACFV